MLNQSFNRRRLLHAGLVGGIGMWATACSPPTSETVQQSSTKAPLAANPAASTAATSQEVVANITSAATQFLNGLTDPQRATASYAITDPEYLRWHWTTTSGFPRNGLVLRDLDTTQRELALALLRASISEAGFQKSMDIIQLQPEVGGDPENYYVTIFGTPGDPTWSWRFEGHHLSRRFTIAGDKITITPFFTASGPRSAKRARSLCSAKSGRRVNWCAHWMPHCVAR